MNGLQAIFVADALGGVSFALSHSDPILDILTGSILDIPVSGVRGSQNRQKLYRPPTDLPLLRDNSFHSKHVLSCNATP